MLIINYVIFPSCVDFTAMPLWIASQSYNLLDSLIYTGIILLILSQITEKITTFLRNYMIVGDEITGINPTEISRTKKNISKILEFILQINRHDIERGRINNKNDVERTRIELAISKLAIFIGILIAFVFNVNLFVLLKSPEPYKDLGWGNDFWLKIVDFINLIIYSGSFFSNLWEVFIKITGYVITGVLLSFGSQFFHNFLGVLYAFKQTRQRLNDEASIKASIDAREVPERILAECGDPVLAVLEIHKEMLMKKFSSIISIERIFKLGLAYLEIHLEGEEDYEKIKQYKFDYPCENEMRLLPDNMIKIVPNSEIVAAFGQIKIFAGERVRPDTASRDSFGTMGFFARNRRDDKIVLVTCAHVVSEGAKNQDVIVGTKVYAHTDNGSFPIGKISNFYFDSWMDAATIELDSNVSPENIDRERGLVFSEYAEPSGDVLKKDIWVNGAASEPRVGRIISTINTVNINYKNGKTEFYNLIKIIGKDGYAVSKPGDSGAIVFDDKMRAIGMVIAGNTLYSYAIPFSRVLKYLNVNLLNLQSL